MSEEMILQIVNWVVAVIPSLTAIATSIIAIYKIVKQFVELKKEVVDMKEIEDVKVAMNVILEENAKLKTVIYEILQKIDHVKRKDE